MVKPEDVERLVEAHEKVRKALDEQKAPRLAAKILCDELGRLVVGNETLWSGLGDTKAIRDRQKLEKDVLVTIGDFINIEQRIFSDLGIDQSRATPIFGLVCDGLTEAGIGNVDVSPSRESLRILRHLLTEAKDLICEKSKGPVQHAREWLVSWHGARVLAGGAVCLANAAGGSGLIMVGGPTLPHLIPHAASHCWLSIRLGMKVMKGDADGILDLLKPK